MISDNLILGTITKKISSTSSLSSTIDGLLGATNQDSSVNHFNIQKQNSSSAKSNTQLNQQNINSDNVNDQDSDQICRGVDHECNQINTQDGHDFEQNGNINTLGGHH
jgi:hypothetical protein